MNDDELIEHPTKPGYVAVNYDEIEHYPAKALKQVGLGAQHFCDLCIDMRDQNADCCTAPHGYDENFFWMKKEDYVWLKITK